MTREEAIKILADLTDNFFLHTWEEQYKALHMAIEALKAEPTGDLISRADAIRWVKTECNPYGKPTLEFESGKRVIEHLEQMPSANPETKWVPCSERLPEENGWYQCTVVLNDLSQTMELFYKNEKWLDNRRINMFDTYDIYGYGNTKEKHKLSYQELISEFDWTENVIVWMPLPKPYKGGDSE